jgi:hypothetical protein
MMVLTPRLQDGRSYKQNKFATRMATVVITPLAAAN